MIGFAADRSRLRDDVATQGVPTGGLNASLGIYTLPYCRTNGREWPILVL
jgi:hypothetical protein